MPLTLVFQCAMEGLVIGASLPPDLEELDAETLLLDMDNLDKIFSQVPNPGDIIIPEPDDSTRQFLSRTATTSEATQSLEGRFGR